MSHQITVPESLTSEQIVARLGDDEILTGEPYFVADGTRRHIFAESYEQHQKNMARLRPIEAEHKEQAPGPR